MFQFLEAVVSHMGNQSINYWVEKRLVYSIPHLTSCDINKDTCIWNDLQTALGRGCIFFFFFFFFFF